MSTSDHNGRSGVQGPVPDVASHAYRDYGAIEAALGQSQAANNEVPYYRGQGVGIIGKTIVFLILIPFTLICVAIIAGIFGAISGTWIVIGHWILLHLSPAPSPYSEATLWSTFMVGLWGSAATFLPFCVLNASLHVCCMRASCGVGPVLALRFVLGVFKVGLDCVAGVPLVGYYYGMETLGLDYVIRAAYTGGAVMSFVLMGIL